MLPMPLSPEFTPESQRQVGVVPIRFWTDYRPVSGQPGEFRQIDMVELAKKGSANQTTPWNIKALSQEQFWPAIEPYYKAWKAGQDAPVIGTPLDEWPGIHKGWVDQLKLINIRSVEDLANVTDADGERIGMGWRELRNKAQRYIEAKAGDAKLADALSSRDELIAQQANDLAEMREQIAKLMADRPRRERPGDVAKTQ